MVNPVEPFVFPKNPSPVEAIAQRLQGWQSLASTLADYTNQLVDLNRSNSASNDRLAQTLSTNTVKPKDDAVLTLLPSALLKLHSELSTCSRKSAGTLAQATTQLRSIASDAQQRADNIRTYNQHFGIVNQVKEAQTRAKGEIAHYQSALKDKDAGSDPYVLKSRVDRAIGDQINLENKLLENYHTVQTLGAQYDQKIVSALNKAVREIEAGFAASGTIQVEFCKSLKDNIFAPHADAFDQFIVNNKESFITEDVHSRELANARYEGQYASASKAVRKGTLERRTKYLHSFVPAEYVLTLNSLYEIKDGHRTLGIDLTDAELLEDHKHSTDDRFVLRARQQGSSSGKHHTWVFRTDDARKWASDLKKILSAPAGQRAIAVFGSDTFDPEAEASTLSEKGTKAQVPSSLPANAPPADTLSTAAVASGQTTPKDGAALGALGGAGAGVAGASALNSKDNDYVGAAPAQGKSVDSKFDGPTGATNSKSVQSNLKDSAPVVGTGAATTGAATHHHNSGSSGVSPTSHGHSAPQQSVPQQSKSVSGSGPSGSAPLAGAAAPSASAPAASGTNYGAVGAGVGAGALGGAGIAALAGRDHDKKIEDQDLENYQSKYDPHGKKADPSVPVHDADFKSIDQATSAGAVGTATSSKSTSTPKDIKTGSANDYIPTGSVSPVSPAKGDFEGIGSKKYDPHGSKADPAVPVHDTEFSTSKDTSVKDTTGSNAATGAAVGGVTGAATGAAVSGGFEGTSNKSYDPHGKTNEPIVPVHDSHFDDVTAKEIKPSGAIDVSAPVEKKTELGYAPPSVQKNLNASSNSSQKDAIAKPRVGGAYKNPGAGVAAGTVAGGVGAAALHEHNNKDSEAVVPSQGLALEPTESGPLDTTSSQYSKTNRNADSDSASSVSDVEISNASPTEDITASSTSIPPAHSAAWQAQQDLAAFDKKVEDRDTSAIAAGDADSQFSYDKKHRASTYTGEDYKPDDVLPPHVERKLTQTYHKYEDSPLEGIGAARTQEELDDPIEKHLERRRSRSSVSLNRKPSRNATASYGGEELKPLTNPDKSQQGKADLFFADELPASTSGNPTVTGPVGGNAKLL